MDLTTAYVFDAAHRIAGTRVSAPGSTATRTISR